MSNDLRDNPRDDLSDDLSHDRSGDQSNDPIIILGIRLSVVDENIYRSTVRILADGLHPYANEIQAQLLEKYIKQRDLVYNDHCLHNEEQSVQK